MAVSQSTAVTATVYDANNNVLSGRTVSWSVDNSSRATVNPSTGTTVLVFGQSIGSTTVTAGSEGKSFTANVWVGSVVGPTVSFSPPSGTRFTSPMQTLTVRGCHGTLPVTDAMLELSGMGLSYTRTEGSSACSGGFGAEFYTTVTFSQNQNTLAATVSVNNGAASTASSATYFYDVYAVSTTPDGASGGNVQAGSQGTLPFVVTNTGNLSTTFSVSPNCPAGFSCSVAGPSTFTLGSQGTQNVNVNFTAGTTLGNFTVGLTAVIQSPGTGSNSGSYNVTVIPAGSVVANVDVSLNPATIAPSGHSVATASLFDSGGNPISGKSVTWSTSAPSVASVTSTGSLTGDVTGVANGSAWIRAHADNGVKDSALVTVQSGGTPAVIALSNSGLNPGTAVSRDLCLTASVGSSAASECGDLRVVHPLPAVMVKTVTQQPTLVYNSATAHPYPLAAVNVRYTSGLKPDSLEAILRVGGVERRRGKWSGALFQVNIARRLVIGYDALQVGAGDATGIYPYTVEVAAYNSNTRGTPVTVSGQLVVVNRTQSRFGAGWWLSGLEQLFTQGDGSLMWVGGDGSARHYARINSSLWVPQQQLDFPDTIRLASNVYTRYASGGVRVNFNNVGNHISTRRPLGDSTRFVYSVTGPNPILSSIVTLIGTTYTFNYSPNQLVASIAAPYVSGTTRTTTVNRNSNGQISGITDPDNRTVAFG